MSSKTRISESVFLTSCLCADGWRQHDDEQRDDSHWRACAFRGVTHGSSGRHASEQPPHEPWHARRLRRCVTLPAAFTAHYSGRAEQGDCNLRQGSRLALYESNLYVQCSWACIMTCSPPSLKCGPVRCMCIQSIDAYAKPHSATKSALTQLNDRWHHGLVTAV